MDFGEHRSLLTHLLVATQFLVGNWKTKHCCLLLLGTTVLKEKLKLSKENKMNIFSYLASFYLIFNKYNLFRKEGAYQPAT